MELEKLLAKVEKALSTPAINETATLVRENLSDFIVSLPDKETPLRDRLPRKTGSGAAAQWFALTAMGVGNSPFAEGTTPNEDASVYERRVALYKELGKKKTVTDKMLAAGASFADLEAQETNVGMREVIQDEENLIINGDSTNPLEFDGLKKMALVANTFDDNNDTLGFRPELLNKGVAFLLKNYGARATAIYCSHDMHRNMNEVLFGDVRVNLNAAPMKNEVTGFVHMPFFQSAVGPLPIISTTAVLDDDTTFPGDVVSDIHIVTEKHKGQDVLYMEDMQNYSLGKTMLAKTGASTPFMITEATVLVNRAPEYQYLITNVRLNLV